MQLKGVHYNILSYILTYVNLQIHTKIHMHTSTHTHTQNFIQDYQNLNYGILHVFTVIRTEY